MSQPEPEVSANQMLATHLKICAKCRAAYERNPDQTDLRSAVCAEMLFRKSHDQRRRTQP